MIGTAAGRPIEMIGRAACRRAPLVKRGAVLHLRQGCAIKSSRNTHIFGVLEATTLRSFNAVRLSPLLTRGSWVIATRPFPRRRTR